MKNVYLLKIKLNDEQMDLLAKLFIDLAKGLLLGIIVIITSGYKGAIFLSAWSLLSAYLSIYFSLELISQKKSHG